MADLLKEEQEFKEPISLTLNALLTNPTGKYSAYMTSRARIIEDLEMRYAKLINTHKKFEFKIFKNGKDFIYVFKIPSESNSELFYDVVVMFTPEEKEYEKDRTLNRYTLKLFSNSPNFTFTYTYVLNKNKVLVPFLKPKCSEKALTDAPKVKNPVESYGFEKSCYFACMYIKQAVLTNKLEVEANRYLFNKPKIMKGIASQEDKMKEYNLSKASKTKKKASSRTTSRATTKAKPKKKKTK